SQGAHQQKVMLEHLIRCKRAVTFPLTKEFVAVRQRLKQQRASCTISTPSPPAGTGRRRASQVRQPSAPAAVLESIPLEAGSSRARWRQQYQVPVVGIAGTRSAMRDSQARREEPAGVWRR
ncbi:MAG TPA: hypothetical protein VGP46_10510, partial [Acidimicrobiales bacterium]|nr:hypothetical protein [Acidimicrobiales bacterium]